MTWQQTLVAAEPRAQPTDPAPRSSWHSVTSQPPCQTRHATPCPLPQSKGAQASSTLPDVQQTHSPANAAAMGYWQVPTSQRSVWVWLCRCGCVTHVCERRGTRPGFMHAVCHHMLQLPGGMPRAPTPGGNLDGCGGGGGGVWPLQHRMQNTHAWLTCAGSSSQLQATWRQTQPQSGCTQLHSQEDQQPASLAATHHWALLLGKHSKHQQSGGCWLIHQLHMPLAKRQRAQHEAGSRGT
jgi:hypothetical protein